MISQGNLNHDAFSVAYQLKYTLFDFVVSDTPILSCEFPLNFWVGWRGGLIEVGEGRAPFMNQVVTWEDTNFHAVNSIGLATLDNIGVWTINTKDRKSHRE